MINSLFLIGDNLVIDKKARQWCKLPYDGHSNGCPNYNRKETCPPRAPVVEDYFNLNKDLWLIAIEFNLTKQIEKMKTLHPEWSNKQAKCLLYWQPKVNKTLKSEVHFFMIDKDLTYTLCPEAMGINVIQTAKNLGLPIEKRPIDKVYKIAFVGSAK